MIDRIVQDAIRRANKLGAKGVEVVGYMEPQTASQSSDLILIIKLPESSGAAADLTTSCGMINSPNFALG